MLISMTGFGEARLQGDNMALRVEIRAVNNRFLKISLRCNEDLAASAENELETIVRNYVRRGTVQLNVFIEREPEASQYRVNRQVLLGYWQQTAALAADVGLAPPTGLEAFFALPGVVTEREDVGAQSEKLLPLLRQVVTDALEKLQQMRQQEGQAMALDMQANCQRILTLTDQVERRAPLIVENYRQRLQERIGRLLADSGVSLQPEDILKEVGLFAERADISEEIVRLRSHIQQFLAIVAGDGEETPGRRLEFLTQEMFREINTMGSKANDAEVSQCVVEMKTHVERLREMVQNVE